MDNGKITITQRSNIKFVDLGAQRKCFPQTIYIFPPKVLLTCYCKFVQEYNQVYWVLQIRILKNTRMISCISKRREKFTLKMIIDHCLLTMVNSPSIGNFGEIPWLVLISETNSQNFSCHLKHFKTVTLKACKNYFSHISTNGEHTPTSRIHKLN